MSSSDLPPLPDPFLQRGQCATLRVSPAALLLAPLGACGLRLHPGLWPRWRRDEADRCGPGAGPDDKNGFDLVERLEERLGRPEAPRYDLAYTITTEAVGVGITADNKITPLQPEGRGRLYPDRAGHRHPDHRRAGAKLHRLFRHRVHRRGSCGRRGCGLPADAHSGRPDHRPADRRADACHDPEGGRGRPLLRQARSGPRGPADLRRRCDAGGAEAARGRSRR
jgi:hypothetical protein